jgi:hypothetical protein
MPRWFNTAGPCYPADHYMLPAMRRLPEVRRLIDQKGYFVVHAPRQVGKTTALLSLARALTAEGQYVAVLDSMEVGAAFPQDIGAAESAILEDWRHALRAQLPSELHPAPFPEVPAGSRIGSALTAWAGSCPRPLVVFLDEIDALREGVLVSVLRQLRSGYRNRPELFPASLALIGLRDVRDYKVASGESDHLGTANPFNIKVRSLTLRKHSSMATWRAWGSRADGWSSSTGEVSSRPSPSGPTPPRPRRPRAAVSPSCAPEARRHRLPGHPPFTALPRWIAWRDPE